MRTLGFARRAGVSLPFQDFSSLEVIWRHVGKQKRPVTGDFTWPEEIIREVSAGAQPSGAMASYEG